MGAEELGAYIKQRRQELGISQRQLAKRAGLSASYMAQIEKGSVKWPKKFIDGIAKALDVPVIELALYAGLINIEGMEETAPPLVEMENAARDAAFVASEKAFRDSLESTATFVELLRPLESSSNDIAEWIQRIDSGIRSALEISGLESRIEETGRGWSRIRIVGDASPRFLEVLDNMRKETLTLLGSQNQREPGAQSDDK